MGLGAPELIIILVVVLVLFGGAKLPQLARSLGEAGKEFRKGAQEGAGDAPAARSGEKPVANEHDANPPAGS